MDFKSLLYSLRSAALGMAASLVLLVIFAFAAYNTPDPNSLVGVAAVIPLVIGGLASGLLASLSDDARPLVAALLAGIAFAVILAFASLVASLICGQPISMLGLLISCGVSIATSAVGGFVGQRRRVASHSKKSMLRSVQKRAKGYSR